MFTIFNLPLRPKIFPKNGFILSKYGNNNPVKYTVPLQGVYSLSYCFHTIAIWCSSLSSYLSCLHTAFTLTITRQCYFYINNNLTHPSTSSSQSYYFIIPMTFFSPHLLILLSQIIINYSANITTQPLYNDDKSLSLFVKGLSLMQRRNNAALFRFQAYIYTTFAIIF